MSLFTILIGFVGLLAVIYGAELTVKNGRNLALKLNVPPFFIGLTLLSIGTSLPEIFTHLMSSYNILVQTGDVIEISGIAVGTNIGSNLCAATLVTGIAGLFGVIKTSEKFLKRDFVMLIISIVLVQIFALSHVIDRFEGFLLMLIYCIYIFQVIKTENIVSLLPKKKTVHLSKNIIFLLLGILLLTVGANYVIDVSIQSIEAFGISGSLIGALVIGLITSLPELITALTGILRGSSAMSFGTLVGSNITTLLFALGLGSFISKYEVSNTILWIDLPIFFIGAILIFLLFWPKLQLSRWKALILVLFYLCYVGIRIFVASYY